MATALPMFSPERRLDPAAAADLARIAKALADPVRLRIVDAVRQAAPEAICQCEITPLFDISQPAVSKHLKVLVEAGVLAVERRGAWAFYFVPDHSTLGGLESWLS